MHRDDSTSWASSAISFSSRKQVATSEDRGGSSGQNREVFHPHSFVSVEVVEDNRWKLKPKNRSSWYNSRE